MKWLLAPIKISAACSRLTSKPPNKSISEESVLDDIKRRDQRDSTREDAPLKPASDAHLLDTSRLSIDAAFAAARRMIDQALEDDDAQ